MIYNKSTLLQNMDIKPDLQSVMNNGIQSASQSQQQRDSKPYACQMCPKKFANNSYLSQHLRIRMSFVFNRFNQPV
jgi:hypothetical protein